LDNLVPAWLDEVTAANLEPGAALEITRPRDVLGKVPVEILAGYPFQIDTAAANGSSIAFLATFGGKTVLFGADAHPDILVRNLARVEPSLLANGITALKLSHHGSKGNTNDELVNLLNAEHYLVSTNGSIYEHPDDEAIARVLSLGPEQKHLHFNYCKPTNSRWADEEAAHGYRAHYGSDEEGLIVEL
jgi:beta-lactamase superfamily II metal-dependent hydrolase